MEVFENIIYYSPDYPVYFVDCPSENFDGYIPGTTFYAKGPVASPNFPNKIACMQI